MFLWNCCYENPHTYTQTDTHTHTHTSRHISWWTSGLLNIKYSPPHDIYLTKEIFFFLHFKGQIIFHSYFQNNQSEGHITGVCVNIFAVSCINLSSYAVNYVISLNDFLSSSICGLDKFPRNNIQASYCICYLPHALRYNRVFSSDFHPWV